MRTMSSAEFRKTYPRLRETVAVTALGHIIGHYVPVTVPDGVKEISEWPSPHPATVIQGVPKIVATTKRTQQTERDAILRKINKGG